MADLSDVTAYLLSAAITACYPNGTSSPSVAGNDIRLYEGWPLPDQLDQDLGGYVIVNGRRVARTDEDGGPVPNVSVFPMNGNTAVPFQIQNDTYTISYPSFGMSLTVSGNLITFSGQPKANEYVSIITDGLWAFSETGANQQAIITALASDFSPHYAGVVAGTGTLTIPFGHKMTVRQGGQGSQGIVTHRQRQSVMVSVWAPTRALRNTISAAVDNYIKLTNRITLPDTSQAIVCYSRTNVNDDRQISTIYRRDLIYDVEYATVDIFPAYVVTVFETQITAPLGAITPAVVTAIT